MQSPARAALMVTVMLGLTGCFDDQRGETFEDTVVQDDVDVRVLHAVADAPALRLGAGGETRIETLDYGKAETFSLPANQHTFRLEGDTGRESLELLSESLQANLREDRRHDLLLTGSLASDSLRAVLLTRSDEPFDPFEDEDDEPEVGDGLDSEEDSGDEETDSDDEPVRDVRFRAAHLTEGGGAVDLYLGDDRSGDPDATLDYGESTDAIRVEAGVYRLQVTRRGDSSDVLYDSGGNLDWESEDDLVLAVVPNTGVRRSDDSPLSLVVVDGEETRHRPDRNQEAELAFVNGTGSDVDLVEDDRGIDWTAPFLGTEPDEGYEAVDAAGYTLDLDDGTNDCDECYGFGLGQGIAGTFVLRALPDEDSADASFLASDARPVATNARVRLLNADSEDEEPLDLYLIESDCADDGSSLPEDGVIPEPLVSDLAYPNRSLVLPVPEGEYQLVATARGDPSAERLCETVRLEDNGIYELIVAAPDDGSDDPKLITVGGVR